jgi:hypothetical protein
MTPGTVLFYYQAIRAAMKGVFQELGLAAWSSTKFLRASPRSA